MTVYDMPSDPLRDLAIRCVAIGRHASRHRTRKSEAFEESRLLVGTRASRVGTSDRLQACDSYWTATWENRIAHHWHLDLAARVPILRLKPADTKNREAADVPLRADLVDDFRNSLALELQLLKDGRRTPSGSRFAIPVETQKLSMSERLFNVPTQMVKALNRDIVAAGIAKKAEPDRSVDFQTLRHSFGKLLRTSRVAPTNATSDAIQRL